MKLEILDDDFNDKTINKIQFRPLAMIIEGFTLIGIFIGLLSVGSEIKTIGLTTSALIYLISSWYIFKAEKFKLFDVLISLAFGFIFSIIIIGWLFELNVWEGKSEMNIISSLTIRIALPIIIVISFVKFLKNKKSKNEFSMSYKILSRLILFVIISLILGVDRYYIDLFN